MRYLQLFADREGLRQAPTLSWAQVISLLILTSSIIFGSDELFITLGNEQELFPTYIEHVGGNNSSLPKNYLPQLHAVLSFDISNNGVQRLVDTKQAEQIKAIVAKSPFESAIDIPALQKTGLSYLIRPYMDESGLRIQLVELSSKTSRTIGPVECSGVLDQDRKKIHKIADTIHQFLFGKPGVASSRILYVSKRKIPRMRNDAQFTSEVFEADYDGHNARQITQTGSLCATPLWIPSPGTNAKNRHGAHSFLYVSYELGQPKFYTCSLYGGRPKRVSTMRGNQLTPALTQDGSALAFCSDITGTADLYLVQFENSVGAIGKPRQIFHVRGTATGCPAFSPDGKKIAFVSNKDGSARVYVMDIPAPGTKASDLKPLLISKRCRNNTAPAWSPDGKKIAYSARNSGDRQIWVYDFEQDTERQLTDNPGSKESPSWAPDSLHLIFHTYTKSGCSLYMNNLHQPTPVKISSGNEDALFAVWEPISVE